MPNCFETIHFVRILEDNYKPDRDRYNVDSLGRTLFYFAAAKRFRFIFAIRGASVFLEQFCPYCIARKPHVHDAASCHGSIT